MAKCSYTAPIDGWRCPEEAITADGLCIFHDPNLKKDAGLLKARFGARLAQEDPLRLDGAIFPDGVSFRSVVFKHSVSFLEAKFHGQKTSFDEAKFHGQETSFGGAEFHGQETSFVGAEFHGQQTWFVRAEFHGQETSFAGAEFHGQRTWFDRAKFHGQQTSFSKAEFHGQDTSFVWAEFHGQETSFRGAKFHGQQTWFHWAKFHSQQTSFVGAKFHGQQTSFLGAKFHGQQTWFYEAEFHGQETSFVGAEFHGRTIFRGATCGTVFVGGKGAEVNLRGITVAAQGELIFDWVGLSRARFLHADLTRVKFLDVTWNHPQRWGRWRSRVYDEACWLEERRKRGGADEEYLPQLGRLYRALKAYYQSAGEHQLVGHFNYGLMEVRWYQKELEEQPSAEPDAQVGDPSLLKRGWLFLRRKRRKWLSWEAAFRYSSGYGEDYAWAFMVLLVLIAVFSACYFLSGVPVEEANHGIRMRLQGAVLYNFQPLTFGRLPFYKSEAIPTLARFLYVAEMVLVPIQAAFFALALRNRFRR